MENKYSFRGYDKEKMVAVKGSSLPISTKTSREIARFIKGKKVSKMKAYLAKVVEAKLPIPFTKFNRDTPHRKGRGFGPGRFPKKASQVIGKLLHGIEKQAENKGLDLEKLKLIHVAAQKGPNIMHWGRQRGKRKITHVELIAAEEDNKK